MNKTVKIVGPSGSLGECHVSALQTWKKHGWVTLDEAKEMLTLIEAAEIDIPAETEPDCYAE